MARTHSLNKYRNDTESRWNLIYGQNDYLNGRAFYMQCNHKCNVNKLLLIRPNTNILWKETLFHKNTNRLKGGMRSEGQKEVKIITKTPKKKKLKKLQLTTKKKYNYR